VTPRFSFRAVLAGIVVLWASACGFQPLYGVDAGGAHIVGELAGIHIAEVNDRLGLAVRNDLLDLVTPLGEPAEPRYVLRVSLFEERQGIAIERDATITRFTLTLTANYDLEDARTRMRVNSGTARATAAYNVLRAEFANVVAKRDAETRAARVVAEEIKTRLSIHFARTPGAL